MNRSVTFLVSSLFCANSLFASSAFNYLSTPVDVTPAAGSWETVDVSAYVPEGATGVIVQWVNASTTNPYQYGIRAVGSGDTFWTRVARADVQGVLMAGLDTNRTFEIYTQNLNVTFHLIGYTMEGVRFFTTAPDNRRTRAGCSDSCKRRILTCNWNSWPTRKPLINHFNTTCSFGWVNRNRFR